MKYITKPIEFMSPHFSLITLTIIMIYLVSGTGNLSAQSNTSFLPYVDFNFPVHFTYPSNWIYVNDCIFNQTGFFNPLTNTTIIKPPVELKTFASENVGNLSQVTNNFSNISSIMTKVGLDDRVITNSKLIDMNGSKGVLLSSRSIQSNQDDNRYTDLLAQNNETTFDLGFNISQNGYLTNDTIDKMIHSFSITDDGYHRNELGILTNLPSDTIDEKMKYLVYNSKVPNISIEYPSTWGKMDDFKNISQVQPNIYSLDELVFVAPQDNISTLHKEIFSLSVGGYEDSDPCDPFGLFFNRMVNLNYLATYPNFKLLDEGFTEISGYPAYGLLVSHLNGNFVAESLQIFTVINGNLITLEYDADSERFDHHLPTVREMIKSVNITQ